MCSFCVYIYMGSLGNSLVFDHIKLQYVFLMNVMVKQSLSVFYLKCLRSFLKVAVDPSRENLHVYIQTCVCHRVRPIEGLQ